MAHSHSDNKNVATAFFLNLGFTIIEIIGGFLTNSIAIQSDALHDAGDTISLGFAWYFQKLSKRGRDNKYTFGYKRFNTLGAMITGVVLAAGSVYILIEAIPRLLNPEETNVQGMIWLAILGVFVNGLAVLRLKKGGDSLNEQVMTWHLLEDVLGWIAVLIGSVMMYFYDAPWIDPALSIGITLYVLLNVVKKLQRAGKIILQAAPDDIDVRAIQEKLESATGVKKAHHIHLWTLDGEYNLLSAHIQTSEDRTVSDLESTKEEIRSELKGQFHIDHITLEFEPVEKEHSTEKN
ncbi:MAG: cation diffusion facilitator family transporter [Lewinella sp.]|uniref:cation diffusion facilitator family transporter n=1 Tax=Lewinella sp. TaxID=2004506 RepID=UPI003D6A2ECA